MTNKISLAINHLIRKRKQLTLPKTSIVLVSTVFLFSILFLSIPQNTRLAYSLGRESNPSSSTHSSIISAPKEVHPQSFIVNETVWINQVIDLNETVTISTGGNLTIINSRINCEDAGSGFEIENNGSLIIKDSIIEFGNSAVSGDTRGTLILSNATFSDFVDDIIKLEGDYGVGIDRSVFQRGNRDAVDLEDLPHQVNITNSLFLENGKDGIKTDGLSLSINNCQFIGQGDEGIQFAGGAFSSSLTVAVTNSVFTANEGDGIDIRYHLGFAFIENVTIQDGLDDGIDVELGQTELIIRNATIHNHLEAGIEINDVASIIIEHSTITDSTHSGIQCNSNIEASINNCVITGNTKSGIYASNVTRITIKSSIITDNVLEGIYLSLIQNAEIYANVIIDNTGFSEGSNGLSIFQTESISINNTIISDNSGIGILLDNSKGVVYGNNITGNNIDGLNLINETLAIILNNNISANVGHGIYVSNTSYATINYNSITANNQFGIFASENRVDGKLIDANYNYWGSDSGPSLEIGGGGLQNGVSGPINVSYILTSQGEIKVYAPPKPLGETNLLLIILLTILGTIVISILVVWFLLNNHWRNETQPQMTFIITSAGLPAVQHVLRATKVKSSDITLLSGFISAIESFSSNLIRDLAKTSHQEKVVALEEIKHSVFTVLLRVIKNWVLVLLVLKSNPLIRRRMNRFSRDVLNLLPEKGIKEVSVVTESIIDKDKFIELAEKYFGDLPPTPHKIEGNNKN